LETKLKLQWFEFPQGLTFDGKKFRTAEVANVFKVKSAFLGADSTTVDFDGLNWNQLMKELQLIQNIVLQ
jgi:hypothetical protein